LAAPKQKINSIADRMFAFTKSIRLPGARGMTLYSLGKSFFANIKNIRLAERAAAISFNFLMAIPATLIFLCSLIPFLPLDSVQETILNSIRLLSPNATMYGSAERLITDFMQTKRRELLSIGFLFTIFASSNGVMGVLRSFDRVSPAHVARSGMARRWKAIRLTIGLILVVLISLALLIIQTSLLDRYMADIVGSPVIIKTLSWITLVFIIYLTICMLYKYGPSLQYKFPFFSTGALIATLLFIVISYGFFFVASNFVNYNKVYGSIGTLVMLMAWMFITGLVILIGFEINLSIMMQTRDIDGSQSEK
jgi:membrane protein